MLGPLELAGPHGPVDIRPGLPRALLSTLVVRLGHVVPVDVLVDQLWADRAPLNPANALQVQVSYVRRQLRPLGTAVRIERDGAGYRLSADPATVDARRFEAVVDRTATALTGPLTTTAGRHTLADLDEALSWWRGDAFADARDVALVEPDHHRLEQLRLVAHEQRGCLLDLLGRHAEAAAWLEPLTAEHPLREGLWAALIRALYRAGRQGDALRAYSAARTILGEQLGVEPGPELRELERAVLAHDARLLAPGTTNDGAPQPSRTDDRPTAVVTEVADVPGPTAVASRPSMGRLPASKTSLIGRNWELQQVQDLVAAHRLVTLVGPGGVGKTRLAFEAARHIAVPTSVIELSGVEDPSIVPALVATALSIPSDTATDPLDAIADHLADREWMLLLDTCEHVIDVVATLASRLLDAGPDVRILATSRQPIDIAGEVTWPVPLLQLPDAGRTRATEVGAAAAVRLFVERARASNPTFELDDDNAGAIADICTALDGLPLAIELAAARTGVLSPQAVRDRLQDRFALLTGHRRDVATRQRSLLATVEWSYDQLDPAAREMFRALGVFASSFDLAGAAAPPDRPPSRTGTQRRQRRHRAGRSEHAHARDDDHGDTDVEREVAVAGAVAEVVRREREEDAAHDCGRRRNTRSARSAGTAARATSGNVSSQKRLSVSGTSSVTSTIAFLIE